MVGTYTGRLANLAWQAANVSTLELAKLRQTKLRVWLESCRTDDGFDTCLDPRAYYRDGLQDRALVRAGGRINSCGQGTARFIWPIRGQAYCLIVGIRAADLVGRTAHLIIETAGVRTAARARSSAWFALRNATGIGATSLTGGAA